MAAQPVRVNLFLIPAALAITLQPFVFGADAPTGPGVGFPMVAIAGGQTARINALNNAAGGPPLSSGRVPRSCAGGITFEFYSGDGELIKKKVVSALDPGGAVFVDLSHDELPKRAGRMQIRAVLRFGYPGGARPSPEMTQLMACDLLPSLEIFDNATGKAGILLTETKALPEPNPPRH